ncbi:MAG: VWA domain-containing protein, partial [bacterium]|nr:VWA domain-containing protein [bacterium]
RKGLKDLEGIDGKKILILIADGSDTCEEDFAGAIEKLSQAMGEEEIHVIGLGIREEKERSELNLLAAKSNGAFYNVSNSSQVAERIRKIAGEAIKAEERRLRHLAEEKARLAELADKTRLVVELISDVTDFFCTGIEVVDLQINGKPIPMVEQRELSCADQITVFDSPVPKGDHTVLLTYSKANHGDVSRSRPETFTVKVESGKTTRLRCRTVGHLFYWGLESEMEIEQSP